MRVQARSSIVWVYKWAGLRLRHVRAEVLPDLFQAQPEMYTCQAHTATKKVFQFSAQSCFGLVLHRSAVADSAFGAQYVYIYICVYVYIYICIGSL